MLTPKKAAPGLRWIFTKRNYDKELYNFYLTGCVPHLDLAPSLHRTFHRLLSNSEIQLLRMNFGG